MPCCVSLWVHLVWVSLHSYNLIPVSFIWFRKFSAIILSNVFCISLSLFSLSGIPIMWMLVWNVCFYFCFSDWVISVNLSSRLLSHSLVSPNLNMLIPSSVFFFLISIIIFFRSDWFFFKFSSSLLKFSLYLSIFPSSVSTLIIIAMTSLWGELFTWVSLGYFQYFFSSFI